MRYCKYSMKPYLGLFDQLTLLCYFQSYHTISLIDRYYTCVLESGEHRGSFFFVVQYRRHRFEPHKEAVVKNRTNVSCDFVAFLRISRSSF